MPLLVTTSYNPSPELQERSRRLAERLNARYVPRRSDTLPRLRKRYNTDRILLLTEEGLRFQAGSGEELFFHPGTALLRIKRLLSGERDVLLELSTVEPGDAVIDCTAGLASDAIVFAYAVGDRGSVTALESEPIVHLIVAEGLSGYRSEVAEVNEAMRRIRLVQADHLDYLRGLPDKSADVVYFDPMFRRPIDDASDIRPLRDVANGAPLREEAVREAVRVARKRVVLKEHRDSGEFSRLGFRKIGRGHTKIAYGVIEL